MSVRPTAKLSYVQENCIQDGMHGLTLVAAANTPLQCRAPVMPLLLLLLLLLMLDERQHLITLTCEHYCRAKCFTRGRSCCLAFQSPSRKARTLAWALAAYGTRSASKHHTHTHWQVAKRRNLCCYQCCCRSSLLPGEDTAAAAEESIQWIKVRPSEGSPLSMRMGHTGTLLDALTTVYSATQSSLSQPTVSHYQQCVTWCTHGLQPSGGWPTVSGAASSANARITVCIRHTIMPCIALCHTCCAVHTWNLSQLMRQLPMPWIQCSCHNSL
jgi:hypothetical protein